MSFTECMILYEHSIFAILFNNSLYNNGFGRISFKEICNKKCLGFRVFIYQLRIPLNIQIEVHVHRKQKSATGKIGTDPRVKSEYKTLNVKAQLTERFK